MALLERSDVNALYQKIYDAGYKLTDFLIAPIPTDNPDTVWICHNEVPHTFQARKTGDKTFDVETNTFFTVGSNRYKNFQINHINNVVAAFDSFLKNLKIETDLPDPFELYNKARLEEQGYTAFAEWQDAPPDNEAGLTEEEANSFNLALDHTKTFLLEATNTGDSIKLPALDLAEHIDRVLQPLRNSAQTVSKSVLAHRTESILLGLFTTIIYDFAKAIFSSEHVFSLIFKMNENGIDIIDWTDRFLN